MTTTVYLIKYLNLIAIQVWDGFISIRDGPYEGAKFKLTVTFNKNYPVEAPLIKFAPGIFHPLIDIETGEVDMKVHSPIIPPL